eukprot:TRINITY_DN2476_c0_g1_i2.p1 TRINITY_DN2476_c0_g1~~TRINITY_DN2476_c0_g1_i2.p1  ORF type:complete len:373 (-),score=80.21 TRINITY_DN2476_c0_g1_i2:96-1214(-)
MIIYILFSNTLKKSNPLRNSDSSSRSIGSRSLRQSNSSNTLRLSSKKETRLSNDPVRYVVQSMNKNSMDKIVNNDTEPHSDEILDDESSDEILDDTTTSNGSGSDRIIEVGFMLEVKSLDFKKNIKFKYSTKRDTPGKIAKELSEHLNLTGDLYSTKIGKYIQHIINGNVKSDSPTLRIGSDSDSFEIEENRTPKTENDQSPSSDSDQPLNTNGEKLYSTIIHKRSITPDPLTPSYDMTGNFLSHSMDFTPPRENDEYRALLNKQEQELKDFTRKERRVILRQKKELYLLNSRRSKSLTEPLQPPTDENDLLSSLLHKNLSELVGSFDETHGDPRSSFSKSEGAFPKHWCNDLPTSGNTMAVPLESMSNPFV